MRTILAACALLFGCGETFSAASSPLDPPLDAATERGDDVGAGIVDGAGGGSHDAGADVVDALASADSGQTIGPGLEASSADVVADVVDAQEEDVGTCPPVDPTTPNIPCGCAAAPAPGCAAGIGCRWSYNYGGPAFCAQECGLIPCQ